MMSRWLMLGTLTLLCGCASLWAKEDERDVDLSQVPEKVKAVATRALPGITLKKAEIENKGSGEIYELKGILDGKEYEIKIKPDGTLVKLELEGEQEHHHPHHKKGNDDDDHHKEKDDD